MGSYKKISLIIIVGFIVLFGFSTLNKIKIPLIKQDLGTRQLILIVADGIQVNNFKEMLGAGLLPTYSKIIENGGIFETAIITGHTRTETAPGNAEIHSGLPSSVTGIEDNSCNKTLPLGVSVFERLKSFDEKIITGSIYGKKTCYIPNSILKNAKSKIDWWQDLDTFDHKNYILTKCADSVSVGQKTKEFIKQNANNSFYLFVYLGAPDCAGHESGENSLEYKNSLLNTDAGLRIVLEEVNNQKINPVILITSDHGWTEGSKNHSAPNKNTQEVILISNTKNIISKDKIKKQCDVAPTILNYFGMNFLQYRDIVKAGCFSLTEN